MLTGYLTPRRLSRYGVLMLSVLLFTGAFYFTISSRYSQIARSEDRIQFTDFTYYLENVKQFWFGDKPSIYRLDTQIEILAGLLGQETGSAILPHLTPVALVVWFPLAWVDRMSSSLSHALWMGVSLSLYLLGIERVFVISGNYSSGFRFSLVLVHLVGFVSFSCLACIVLGQSSIFVSALLMFLVVSLKGISEAHTDWGAVLALTALAIKPQFYLWGIAIAMLFRRWRELLVSLGVVLTICILLSPRLGLSWPLEYLEMTSIHSQTEPPAYCEQFIVVEIMTNFRGAFSAPLGESTVLGLSLLLFTIGTGGSLAVSAMKSLPYFDRLRSLTVVDPLVLINVLIGSYLLFSPHLYNYEELLYVVMVTLAALGKPTWAGKRLTQLFFVVSTAVVLNPGPFLHNNRTWMLWVIKFACILCLICYGHFMPSRPEQRSSH